MLLSQSSCKLDDGLHSLHLSLYVWIEIFLSNCGEIQEMDRTIVLFTRRQELSQSLVQTLGYEWRERGLDECEEVSIVA